MNIKILNAEYGFDKDFINVTKQVQELSNKSLFFKVDNYIAGDPAPGKIKTLNMSFIFKEIFYQIILFENDVFNLDKLFIDKNKESVFVAFYTNNNINEKILQNSLKHIKKMQEFSQYYNVFVGSSVWEKIYNNPFPEIISPLQNQGSLNIALQILDCLSFSKNLNIDFKYFMLAEHDVLYPESYIDHLDSIKYAPVIANTNYIGMCEKGYQTEKLDHAPLHQLVFDYEYALYYFPNLILNKMFYRHFVLEPQESREQWAYRQTDLPAVHINHKSNFTSHYDTYDKKNIITTHPYWGFYKNYYPKNESSNIKW